MSPDTIKGAAREAGDHPALEMAARIGYAVSGLLHLLIGWIALQVAWGSSGKSADQSGALASLAGNGVGRFGLWVAVIGFLGLAIWQVVEAVGGSFGEGMDAWAGRGKAVAKAVVYLVLGWTHPGLRPGQAVQQPPAERRLHRDDAAQHRRPHPGRRHRPGRDRRRRLPRLQGGDQAVPARPRGEPGHGGHPGRAGRLHRQGRSPWPSSACSSSWPG